MRIWEFKTRDEEIDYAKEKQIATPTELMLALVQDDLQTLQNQGLLPADADLQELKAALIQYYDLEVRLDITRRALLGLQKLRSPNGTNTS